MINQNLIQKANAKMDCFDITILDENDTVGNLLTTYLLNEKNVEYTLIKFPIHYIIN